MTTSNDATTPIDAAESVDTTSGSPVVNNTDWPEDPPPIYLTEGDDSADFGLPFGVNTTIYALSGNDTIEIHYGAATIYGGAGDDRITAASDVPGVFIDGGDGNDRLFACDNATLIGGNGNDSLIVDNRTGSLNILDGGAGQDYFGINGVGRTIAYGGDGEDQFFLALDGNSSLLFGGAGNDSFMMRAGVAWVDGGDGNDFVNYFNTAAVSIDLVNQQNGGGAAGQFLSNIEDFQLSRYGDVFLGTSAPEHVFGGAGDDNLYGGGGDDHLDGGDGNDWLDGGAGSDTLSGGNGFDTLSYLDATAGVSIVLTELSSTWTWTGDAQDDLLNSIEQIQLSNFADTFRGDANANWALGGAGDDQIFGAGGDDVLYGDAGNDLLDGGAGADTLAGGAGWDIASYQDATAGVGIDLTKASSAWTGDAQGDVMTSIEQIDLSDFADTFRGNASANTVRGGNGADSLDGGNGDDLLDGGAGADTLAGGAGIDTASYKDATAGVSIDLTNASSTWTGDAQGDVMTSIEAIELSDLADTFRGDASTNDVQGGDGDDQIFGAGGSDNLGGGGGNDTIQGGDGGDSVFGDQGDDYLQGNAGDDLLYGQDGNDRIVGGIGNDMLTGGRGGDYLVGNEGADYFVYTAVEESQNIVIDGVSQLDQIADFTQGQDKIDLTWIDANPALAGDQAFTFITDPAHYTGSWTGVVWQTTAANGVVTVNVSIDGDAAPEMQIYMSHPYQLTASDFIL